MLLLGQAWLDVDSQAGKRSRIVRREVRDMVRIVDMSVPPHKVPGVEVCGEFSIKAGIVGEVHLRICSSYLDGRRDGGISETSGSQAASRK